MRRAQQVAADLRFLEQVRSRTAAVQQQHEALLAQAEAAREAACSAKVRPAARACVRLGWGVSVRANALVPGCARRMRALYARANAFERTGERPLSAAGWRSGTVC